MTDPERYPLRAIALLSTDEIARSALLAILGETSTRRASIWLNPAGEKTCIPTRKFNAGSWLHNLGWKPEK